MSAGVPLARYSLANFLLWRLKQYCGQNSNFLPAFLRKNAEFPQKYTIFGQMPNFLAPPPPATQPAT